MLFRKKLLLLILILISSYSLFSSDKKVDIKLSYWVTETATIDKSIGIGVVNQYKKQIKKTTFKMGRSSSHNILYFIANNHIGYSKVYLNGKLLGTMGSINDIKDNTKITNASLIILDVEGLKSNVNSIKVENYFNSKSITTTYKISSSNTSPISTNIQNQLKKTLPLAFISVTIVFLIIFFINRRKKKNDTGKYYILAFILFIIYFIISGLNTNGLFTNNIIRFSRPFYIFCWLYFIRFYIIKNKLWDINKMAITGFILITSLLSILIVTQYKFLFPNFYFINPIILITLNVFFYGIAHKNKVDSEKIFRIGLLVSLFFHFADLILTIIFATPIFGTFQMSAISLIITYNLSLNKAAINQIYDTEQYSLRLMESISKLKNDLGKKESVISNLKSENEEVVREKSIFFTTLGNNLRTPLNSIIGYSENLYSAKDLSEVHKAVNDIIIESDKIFQSINNVMDFSTRSFSNSDLLLKDFRMKEIFNNSIYESSILTSFSKNIIYKSIGDCDKVIIRGNPIIYKQIMTNVLHFLTELNPKLINYTILDTGITKDHMNLEVKFTAKDLKNTELSLISSIGNYRDIFIKYVKLYNVAFTEEMGDNHYSIELKFQCGITSNSGKESLKELTSNLILSKNLRVMVVEDYIPNLNIVKMHLQKMGCEVLTATNGEEAVEMFSNNDIDVILMDIKMPIMDGWEATEIIRSTRKGLDTFIIGLTASSLDLDIRHCFESGMDDVQVKPIRKKQLYNKLNTLEKLKPVPFPTIGSLRAELCVSKIETETLYFSSINQIEKQLEVIEVLLSANDDVGISKEMPAIIHASLNINAFYYSRLLRNFFTAYKNKETARVNDLMGRLKELIQEAKETYAYLFRD